MSKLDSIDPRPPAALTGIRQPRMLGSASPSPGAAAAVAGLAAQLQQTAVADPLAPAAAASSSAAAAAVLADGSAAGVAGAADASSGGGSCFRYLVLDCDGVLVDSERASCEALHQALLQARRLLRLPGAAGARVSIPACYLGSNQNPNSNPHPNCAAMSLRSPAAGHRL